MSERANESSAQRLVPFDGAAAALVSSWARSVDEVRAWCSHTEAPVPADVVRGWSAPADVEGFVLADHAEVIGYGELWIDDDENEVELARLIVAPEHRGRGVGRELAAGLVEHAHRHHPTAILRVHPVNEAARRCYAAAGFERVAADEELAWNEGQPVAYLWMVRRAS